MMLLHSVNVILTYLVVLGFTTSSACSIREVFECQKAYKGPDAKNLNLNETCQAIQDTKACIIKVSSSCPKGAQKQMLKVVMPSIKKALNACKSPGPDENQAILDCNKAKDTNCDIARSFAIVNRPALCKLLTKLSKCTADFKQKCKSKILQILDGFDESTVDTMKGNQCPSKPCTPQAVLQCLSPYKGQNLDYKTTCQGLPKTYMCLTKSSSNCKTQTQVTVDLTLSYFKKAATSCPKLDSVEKEAIKACYKLKNSNCAQSVSGPNSTCQMLQKGLDCYADFKTKCKSPFLLSVTNSNQIIMKSQMADLCDSGQDVQPTVLPLLAAAVFVAYRYMA